MCVHNKVEILEEKKKEGWTLIERHHYFEFWRKGGYGFIYSYEAKKIIITFEVTGE